MLANKRNRGTEFEPEWITKNCNINEQETQRCAEGLTSGIAMQNADEVSWLLKAIECIDLTTLSGVESFSIIEQLCHKAVHPLQQELVKSAGASNDLHTAAVCVYPVHVAECKKVLSSVGPAIKIASVAGGFPSGQYHLRSKLLEIQLAIEDGATEIDVVIRRDLALSEEWKALYDEMKQMRNTCGEDITLKTILATGELESLSNIYKSSMVCMMAGADFIKTSTGKETVNATLPAGIVMATAIRDYQKETGFQVGFKPAGGIRTVKDAISWQMLMKDQLGDSWLFPDLFRIGASGLLADIEKRIHQIVKGAPLPSS